MRAIIKYSFEYLLFFMLGGCAYYYIEVLSRGFSHWSMFILGGLCFIFCSVQKRISWWRQTIGHQLILCLLFVMAGEFITGCMVNLWLGWNVWDYSEAPLNFMGQICLPMQLAFGILCYMAMQLEEWIRKIAFNDASDTKEWMEGQLQNEKNI